MIVLVTKCYGHGKDDLLEFSDFLSTGDTYTNSEFNGFIRPWSANLPYVYDTYAFDYCAVRGLDLLAYSA